MSAPLPPVWKDKAELASVLADALQDIAADITRHGREEGFSDDQLVDLMVEAFESVDMPVVHLHLIIAGLLLRAGGSGVVQN